MSTPLHSRLARELDCSDQDAQRLLRRLAEKIRDQAPNEPVHLPPFGTFREENGTLSFEPSPSLARAANERYEGLEEEEIDREMSGVSSQPSLDEIIDSALSRPAPPASASDASPLFGSFMEPIDRPPSSVSVDAIAAVQPVDEVRALPRAVWAPRDTTAPAPDSSDASAPDRPPRPSASSADQEASSPERFLLRALLGGLALFFFVGAGWLLLGQQGVVPSPQSALQPAADEPASAPATKPAPPNEEASPPPDDESDPEPAPDPAIEADGINPDAGGWTLIASSRTVPEPAEALASSLRTRLADRSVPVEVLTGTVDGTTRYRVAVGHYASREAALDAREDLTPLLPSEPWLLHFQ